ncbi:thioesterase family protein [Oricola thermophila]|uniref:Thioesterase family protein n=1 Tax=Oricola thermophila TaxID=2742145 RepID=A0A6N1VIZ9_9HYPH|nr:thioesterase family protein [Oricola thermophila]QKV19715.1 thioesterase family protein [Oricola thermophila]
MNLVFRMIQVMLTAMLGGRMDVTEEGRVRLRCWPNDLDINLHMNNGRYLTIMDLGRLDLLLRTGLWRTMRERKWYPVVAAEKIAFRRSLNAFDTFELTTQVIGWDEKWLYIEHRMERDGNVMAQAFIKGLFLGPEGKVPMADLVAAAGHEGPSPEMDPKVVESLS